MAAPSPASGSDSIAQEATGSKQGFPAVFWVANWMELVERFAYYGLRTVVGVYMVLAFEAGGPQFTHIQKGNIYFWWAAVQSFIPALSGGFADRFGYKVNIGISTVIKILGYLVMGYAVQIAAPINGTSVAEVGMAAGGDWTYPVFFTGAMLLAAGTAIFKPGVQGLIGATMPAGKASVGWSVFYQFVNIGGFVGPFLAGYLRVLDWIYVFWACAIGIAFNFIPLFFIKEPERKEGEGLEGQSVMGVFKQNLLGLFRPRVFFFTICFSAFWLMFYQLFDILPNFIDDWVDSSAIRNSLVSIFGSGAIPAVHDGNIPQEWIINVNALLISGFAFAMGYLTGKVRSLVAIIIGIGVSAVAIWMLGESMNGWWTCFAIAVFSLGEMTASPTKLRYMASIAPPGLKGQFLGYANVTVGLGWMVGSVLAGNLYDQGGDKINLALQELRSTHDRGELVQLLTERELIENYAGALDLTPLQTLELVLHPERLTPATDAATLAGFVREHDLLPEEKAATLEGLDLQASVVRIAELTFVPLGQVPLLPSAADESTGAQELDVARKLLEGYEPTREAAGELKDTELLIRLGETLGTSGYTTARILFLEPFREGRIGLAAMAERAGELLQASNPGQLEDLQPEEYIAEAVSELGYDEEAALLALAGRIATGEVTTLESLKEQLESRPAEVPESVRFARGFFLARAENVEAEAEEDGPQEGDRAVAALFLRSRVVRLLGSEMGQSRQEVKEYLWERYKPYTMWTTFALIGLGSLFCLGLYDFFVRKYDAEHGISHSVDV